MENLKDINIKRDYIDVYNITDYISERNNSHTILKCDFIDVECIFYSDLMHIVNEDGLFLFLRKLHHTSPSENIIRWFGNTHIYSNILNGYESGIKDYYRVSCNHIEILEDIISLSVNVNRFFSKRYKLL